MWAYGSRGCAGMRELSQCRNSWKVGCSEPAPEVRGLRVVETLADYNQPKKAGCLNMNFTTPGLLGHGREKSKQFVGPRCDRSVGRSRSRRERGV